MQPLDKFVSSNRGKKLLIPYLTFGFPDRRSFYRIFKEVSHIADILEIGVPFSDPIADGPVIQRCSEVALSQGVSLHEILSFLKNASSSSPVVLMGYSNPFYRAGVRTLTKYFRNGAFQGIIIPDMPIEEAERNGFYPSLPIVFLVAPTTPMERAIMLSERSSGFVYYVSITGITGSRIKEVEEIRKNVTELKRFVSKPVVVGFGISSPSEAREIASFSDGVVIGSALLKKLENGEVEAIRFLARIKEAIS